MFNTIRKNRAGMGKPMSAPKSPVGTLKLDTKSSLSANPPTEGINPPPVRVTPGIGVNPWQPGPEPTPSPAPAPAPEPGTPGRGKPGEGIFPIPGVGGPPTLKFNPNDPNARAGASRYGIGQGFLQPPKEQLFMPLPPTPASGIVIGIPPVPPRAPGAPATSSKTTPTTGRPVASQSPNVGRPAVPAVNTGRATPTFKSPSEVRNFLRLRGR